MVYGTVSGTGERPMVSTQSAIYPPQHEQESHCYTLGTGLMMPTFCPCSAMLVRTARLLRGCLYRYCTYKIGHFYSRRSLAYNLFPAFAFLSADYRLAANLEKLKLKFCEGDQVRIECATVETEILITIKIDDEKIYAIFFSS